MKRALLIVAAVAVGIGGLGLLDAERSFAGPDAIFWRLGLPLLVGSCAAAFAWFPTVGRLALGSLLICIATLEVIASLLASPVSEAKVGPDYYRHDESLGWAPRPSARVRASKRVDGRLIYATEYSIDARGRRVTPVSGSGARERFLLFFGGSCTFGEGVAQNETLPFFVGERAPGTAPYNYGFHGYGPQHLLARLEDGNLRDEIAETEGGLVYLLIDGHVKRAIGSMRVYSDWADSAPNYVLADGSSVQRRGNFNGGRPLRSVLYSLLGRSAALEQLGIDWPLRLGERDFELTAAILARARDLFLERFGPQRFVVVVFPGSVLTDRMVPALRREGLEVFDYTELLDYHAPEYHLPDDWHPTPRTYRHIAERLVIDLGLSGDQRELVDGRP